MGITIHWKGETEDENKALRVVEFARRFAEFLGWEVNIIDEKGYVGEVRIYDEDGNVAYSWIDFNTRKEGDDWQDSHLFGVAINPKNAHTETIVIAYFKHKNKYIFKEFCKTQVFSDDEINNLFVHIILISMLLTIKNTWIPNLDIFDEGDFLLPLDKDERERYIEEYITKEYRDYYRKIKPFNFETLTKAHGVNLSMIALVGKLFGAENPPSSALLGVNKSKGGDIGE